MTLSAGQLIAGRFQLESPLGAGGMGEVWKARHVGLGVECAVKFLHPEAARKAGVRARFEREARAAAQLRSPHVVHIMDVGEEGDRPYIAMELLAGEDLAQRLIRVGALQPREVAGLVTQIARGLQKVHAAGLVHRDLKPANIFLARDESEETVKLLDFGVVKQVDAQDAARTKTGSMLGTPHFMSPEQAQGAKEVDYRSDLWSLGVIAFRALTGRLPFDADTLAELLLKIVREAPPLPSHVAPWVSPSFDAWFLKATAREPTHRFGSALEMAEALCAVLGQPFLAAATAQAGLPAIPAPTMPDPSLLASTPYGGAPAGRVVGAGAYAAAPYPSPGSVPPPAMGYPGPASSGAPSQGKAGTQLLSPLSPAMGLDPGSPRAPFDPRLSGLETGSTDGTMVPSEVRHGLSPGARTALLLAAGAIGAAVLTGLAVIGVRALAEGPKKKRSADTSAEVAPTETAASTEVIVIPPPPLPPMPTAEPVATASPTAEPAPVEPPPPAEPTAPPATAEPTPTATAPSKVKPPATSTAKVKPPATASAAKTTSPPPPPPPSSTGNKWGF
jgi:serine/threonine protein kinase